jgi:hypothetical protein
VSRSPANRRSFVEAHLFVFAFAIAPVFAFALVLVFALALALVFVPAFVRKLSFREVRNFRSAQIFNAASEAPQPAIDFHRLDSLFQ